MKSALRYLAFVLLVVLFAAGVWFVAWWTIPLISAAWALARRSQKAPLEASLAVFVAEVALLLPALISPAFSTLLSQLGALFPVSGAGVVGVTLLLAFVLAYSSARVMLGVVGVAVRSDNQRHAIG